MRLFVKVNNQDTVIVGYGPGIAGQPKAIVILDGALHAVELKDVELQRLPKPLRRKHRRRNIVPLKKEATS